MSELWAILQGNESSFAEWNDELVAELLEIARRQPEAGDVCALLLAAPGAALPDRDMLQSWGVSRLYLLEHPALAHYAAEAWVSALAWFMQQRAPLLAAASASANGRDFMPRLAARLGLPFAPNCLGLNLRDNALFALRSIYDGRAYVQTCSELRGRAGLATLMPGVRGSPASHTVHIVSSLEISRHTPSLSGTQERVRHLAIEAPEEMELEAAERIVAGGRGIGREGFATVASFAKLLGAAVGATRVATDRGWVEHARQIGATGKSVHPRLYIACGISGAAQHTSGMRDAQTVIAINPDRTAPIFALADLGLLGDANVVLPLAAEMIKTRDFHR